MKQHHVYLSVKVLEINSRNVCALFCTKASKKQRYLTSLFISFVHELLKVIRERPPVFKETFNWVVKAVACTRGAQGRWRTCVILLSRPRGSRYRKWHPGSFLVNIRHDSLCSVYRLLYKEEFLFLEEKKEFSFSERKRRERNCERKMKKYHCIIFLHVLINRRGITFFFIEIIRI